jgi:hypothetical protein
MVKTYSIIGELGKDKIQRDITLNIEKSYPSEID